MYPIRTKLTKITDVRVTLFQLKSWYMFQPFKATNRVSGNTCSTIDLDVDVTCWASEQLVCVLMYVCIR